MEITTSAGALLAGLVTSVHCAGMCGPLICGMGTLAKSEQQRMSATVLYHSCRLISYSAIGAVCGAIGQQPLRWFFDSPAALLPWALVIGMLMLAFGIDKIIPRPSWLVRLTARTKLRTGKFSAHGAAGTMGLLTPLLPCGPLYMVFGVALLSASPQKGAEFTLAFGLGTVPLLWIGAQQFSRWRMKLQPRSLQRLQRALMLIAALLIAWRMHDTLPFGAEKQIGEEKLPSCCREEKPQERP
jgi:sulfite exporter TauE/SafE